jgi:hypothetical protein
MSDIKKIEGIIQTEFPHNKIIVETYTLPIDPDRKMVKALMKDPTDKWYGAVYTFESKILEEVADKDLFITNVAHELVGKLREVLIEDAL